MVSFGRTRILPGIAIAVLILAGCSAQQSLILAEDGSGSADIVVSVDPVFSAYLRDVAVGLGGDETDPLFRPEEIRIALEEQPGVSVEQISVSETEDLSLQLTFESINALLQAQGSAATEVLRFERSESFRRLAAAIDGDAIELILGIAGTDPFLTDTLLPPDGETTAAEYRDYLAWAFEEYAGDRPLDLVFRESTIETTIEPAGPIVQIRGGQARNGAAHFVTPLIEAVTAGDPYQYSLVFTPR